MNVLNNTCDDKIAVLPRMRKGALATVIEKGIPQKRSNPKLVSTARPVERTPAKATHTLFLTQSNLKEKDPVHEPRATISEIHIASSSCHIAV